MNKEKIVADHLGELRSTKFPIYKLFDSIPTKSDSRTISVELKDVVEYSFVHALSAKPELFSHFKKLTESTAINLSSIKLWKNVVENAFPVKRDMTFKLNHFCDWIVRINDKTRAVLLDDEKKAALLFHGINEKNAEEFIQTINDLKDETVLKEIVVLVSKFPVSKKNISVSILRIALFQLKASKIDFINKIKTMIKIEDADPNELATLMKLVSEIAVDKSGIKQSLKEQAIDLVLTIAEKYPCNASAVAKEIVAKTNALSDELKDSYLGWFKNLIETNGIRSIGYALERLPKDAKDKGKDKITEYIECACMLGAQYGVTAGEWFLDKRTTVARGLK